MKAIAESTGEQLRRIAKLSGMSYDSLARVLRTSRRTLGLWLAGEEPGRSNRAHVTEFTRFFNALCEVVKPETIGAWMERPSPNFQGSSPMQILERGEIDRLWRMIWEIRGGNSGD